MSLLIGTAGVPHSSRDGSTLSGIKRSKELGLGAMEIEWVRGVRMSEELAAQVKKLANNLNIKLTAHGPYWINLNSQDKKKLEESKQRVLRTIRRGWQCGAVSVTFHPAYYLKQDPQKVYNHLKKILGEIIKTIKNDGNKIRISLETTGKISQFGTVDEILNLSQELDQIWPCIDFAHIYARSLGKINSYEQFREILVKVERALGKVAIKNMHIHLSGIEYGNTGERNHVFLTESKLKYKEVLKALKDFGSEGILICESPIPEKDALLIKKIYNLL